MDDTLAILGRQPALGLAELESLYGPSNVLPIGSHAALLSIMPCSIDFARLGGTIKLCKMLTILETTIWKEIEQFLISVSPSQAERIPEGKLHLGLSTYDIQITPKQMLATGLSIKKAISRTTGRSVHLVPNNEPELNTAQVLHNKLLSDNGWELIFVRDGQRTLVAQTLFIQDIQSYGLRDRNRPKRDARVGMLPPKLAQIIINLAVGPQEFTEVKPELGNDICRKQEDILRMHAHRQDITVLDPFCGTGVLLQEALLMGYGVQGSDLEPRMIEYSQQNLTWLTNRYNIKPNNFTLNIGDATTYKWLEPINIVACEAYLGRPFTSQPMIELLDQTVSDCDLIVKRFLQNIRDQIPYKTRLCLAVPAWQFKPGKFRHLPLIDQIEKLGYNRVSFKHSGKNLLYYRADQIVARQLLVIIRK